MKTLVSGILIAMYFLAIFALTQAVLITIDNQDTLNEMAAKFNAEGRTQIKIRHNVVEQWLGNHIKR